MIIPYIYWNSKNTGYSVLVNFNYQADQFHNNYSETENKQFAEQFSEITSEFLRLMQLGNLCTSVETQKAVETQYEFTCQFWQPNREMFKSLAMMYILPSGYQKYYQDIHPNLGQYVYDAICFWADENLD